MKKALIWGAAAFAVLIVVALFTADDPDAEADAPSNSTATTIDEDPEPTPEPEPEFYEPTEGDFDLGIKTLEKKCFGSAGCLVDFRIQLAYNGNPLDPSKTYELTYEIKGGDDPLINTLTVTGDQYSRDEKENIGTPSSNSKLKAIILDVSEF